MRTAPLVSWLAAGALAACSGQAGTPGAPTAVPIAVGIDAGAIDAGPAPGLVEVSGSVATLADGGVPNAYVVLELGGLDQANPVSDGGLTFASDPFVRFCAITDATGHFSFSRVSAGTLGFHVLDPSYAETTLLASTGTFQTLTLVPPLTESDSGGAPPTVTGLTAPTYIAPTTQVQFAVNVAAGSTDDPLSQDIFLLEPSAQWAGAFSPPTAAVPGGAYPDGVYNRFATSPSQLGVYTYTAIAASLHKRTSTPVSVTVTVTPRGLAPLPDAGPDANVFPDSGLLGP